MITPEKLLEAAKQLEPQLQEWRRTLHRHPEVGFDLPQTKALVQKALTEMGYAPQDCGKSGVLALAGGKKPGKVILLRGDMDALPLQEESGEAFASEVPGKMHGCGHDMHTAMMLGAAKLLKEQLSSVLPIADQNFSKFDMSFYSTRPDGRSGISPRENMEYNLGECKAYAAKFGKDSPNLLLFGSTGLGKTFLSTCIAEAVSARGFSVAYDTAINIVAAYETIKFGSGDGEAAAERAARYERADLLIIDDMGTEMGTAFTVSALYNLINNRLMAKRPMIINTNLLPETLSEKSSPAVASRLLGEFLPLRFFGDDIRLLKMRRT